MPKGKRPPQPPDDELDEGELDEDQIVVSEKLGNAIEVTEHLSDDVESVVISEWIPDRKEQEYLTTIPVEQYSLDYVRNQFGGGRYIVLFKSEAGKIVKKLAFTVSQKFKGAVGTEAPPSGSPAAPGISPEAAMMMGRMQGFEALIQAQGVMMGKAFEALAGSRAAAAPKEGKDPIDVGLEIARIIKDASAPPDRMGVKDMAEMFREGIEAGRLAGSVSTGDSGFGEVVKVFGPPVAKAIESAMDADKAGKGQPTAVPAPSQPAAQVAPPKKEAPVINLQVAPWLIHLRPFIREIEHAASSGADPDAYIPWMTSRMPDNVLDEIDAAAQDPQFIERAISALPAPYLAYKAWFTRALEVLREEVKDEEAPAAPSGPKLEEDDDEPGSGGGQQ